MRSAAARLSIIRGEELGLLRQEMRECLGTIGLNLKTLHQMKQLDRLVNEVRGRADAVLNSAPTLIMRTSIKGTCSHLENKSTKRRLFSILYARKPLLWRKICAIGKNLPEGDFS